MKKQIVLILVMAMAFTQNIFAQNASDQSFNSVITAYINLKNALAADDNGKARDAAIDLYKAIDKMPADKFSKNNRSTWSKFEKKLSYDAEHIMESSDLEHQRGHFISLSKNIYAVAKAFNVNTSKLYYQFCPMADGGKGAYWLSETDKIHNPYFGKKMPSCGSTKETLYPPN